MDASTEDLKKRTEEILARAREGDGGLIESTAPYVLAAQEEARRRLAAAEAKERENDLRPTALNAREQTLDEIAATQEATDRVLTSRGVMVSSREEAVKRSEDALGSREERVDGCETAVAERERQASSKERNLNSLAEDLETAQGLITTKQGELAQREDTVKGREQEVTDITALCASQEWDLFFIL